MAELAQSANAGASLRRAHKDVRSRRMRRPADFGASHSSSSQLRGHSCAGRLGEAAFASDHRHQVAGSSDSSSSRASSTPPHGTDKADASAALAAKAKAVATLQRLFFEEMAKNCHDANDAAARALLRLSEVPSSFPAAPSPSSASTAGQTRSTTAQALARCAVVDEEAPDAVEEAPAAKARTQDDLLAPDCSAEPPAPRVVLPRRPAASVEGRRRPHCPGPRIKVGA